MPLSEEGRFQARRPLSPNSSPPSPPPRVYSRLHRGKVASRCRPNAISTIPPRLLYRTRRACALLHGGNPVDALYSPAKTTASTSRPATPSKGHRRRLGLSRDAPSASFELQRSATDCWLSSVEVNLRPAPSILSQEKVLKPLGIVDADFHVPADSIALPANYQAGPGGQARGDDDPPREAYPPSHQPPPAAR